MIAVVDYGVGNLFSLSGSLKSLGLESKVTADPGEIGRADRIILPGVGAFGDAAAALRRTGLVPLLRSAAEGGTPFLGICLGMQLLFERSYEYGCHEGLGFLPGEVRPLGADAPGLKIPHMGWNSLDFCAESPLFRYSNPGDYVYFVHSYHAVGVGDSLLATAKYGCDVTAAVGKGNVFGTQFHPEKSGKAGLNILRAFAEVKKC